MDQSGKAGKRGEKGEDEKGKERRKDIQHFLMIPTLAKSFIPKQILIELKPI